jgi:tryptophan-rich sensory protein
MTDAPHATPGPHATAHAPHQRPTVGRPQRSRAADVLGLGVALFVSYATAALGALASADAPEFYAQLVQPSWSPPASVFGPVWSILFTLMGVAAWLVWRAPGRRRVALVLFGAQLAVNALWSWLFFAWRLGAAATVEIVVLVALLAATILAFRRHSRLATALLVPYLAWVTFAAVLTFVLWRANPTLL